MTIKYHQSQEPVLPGDHVEIRTWLFFRTPARVIYVSGISPRNDEMERDSHSMLAVEYGDRRIKAWPIFDGTDTLSGAVKFIRRSDGGFKELKPDEELT